MSSKDLIHRRMFLSLAGGAALLLAAPGFAMADDGSDSGGGGSESSGDSGGSDDSGGGDDSGSDGSDDNGGDNSGGDDSSDDSGEDDSNSGSGSASSGSGKRDQDRAKDAVRNGDAIPLAKALELLKKKYDGRVIEVLYFAKGARIDYRFKIVGDSGKITSVTMDARSGRIRGFFGF